MLRINECIEQKLFEEVKNIACNLDGRKARGALDSHWVSFRNVERFLKLTYGGSGGVSEKGSIDKAIDFIFLASIRKGGAKDLKEVVNDVVDNLVQLTPYESWTNYKLPNSVEAFIPMSRDSI